jgi:hypothetical protein
MALFYQNVIMIYTCLNDEKIVQANTLNSVTKGSNRVIYWQEIDFFSAGLKLATIWLIYQGEDLCLVLITKKKKKTIDTSLSLMIFRNKEHQMVA